MSELEPKGGQYGAIAFRDFGDGRGLWVYPMLYTYRLVIGRIGDIVYTDGWCYRGKSQEDLGKVLAAIADWNPFEQKEPCGWVRHPQTGRRRFPDGDPATEEVRM